MFTLALYFIYNSSTYYCNPVINKCWLVVNIFITWTIIIIYLLPYFYVISTSIANYKDTTENLFWYLWGYSIPCLVFYVIIGNSSVDWKDGWKMLFL